MKNLIKFIVPAVIATVALVSCQQEIGNDETSDENAISIRVYASADEVYSDIPSSKTYIDGTAIKWGTGEYMKIGVFDGTATEFGDSTDETADKWSGYAQAYFNFSITPANASGEYTYYGLYPASSAVASSNTNPASYKVNLPSSQSATASSYDPRAYILVARPDPGHNAANADWTAFFRRATALNRITLKNLSEDIKRVTITAPTGTYLAGARHIDLTTGASGDIYSGGGRTETVDVRYASKLSGGANMDIWFTSWDAEIPVGQHLVIVAYSDTHTFTRDLTVVNKSITFKEGYLNTLSVNMSSADQGDNTELEDGNYLILANNSGTYYALKAEAESTRMNYESYTGSLDSYAGDASIIWTVGTSDGVRTITNDSNYLGWSSGNTATLQAAGDGWTATNYGMDITWKSDHYEIAVHSDNSRILAKNTGTYGFAFYNGSGYKNIVFVPATVDSRTEVVLSFAESSIGKTTANYDEFTGQSATAEPDESAITSNITYSIVGDAIGTIDSGTGAVSLNGTTGSATVTASFAGNEDYRAAKASYTITVSSDSPSQETGWIETAVADLGASDVFVIVGNNGNTYAMTNDNGTGSAPAASSVTVSGTKLSGVIADNIKWNISGNSSDGYTFYPNGSTTTWLYCTNTNNGVRVGTNNDNKSFTISDGYLFNTGTSRFVGIYNSQDWRCYTSIVANIANQSFTFYKYVDAPDTREEASLTWKKSGVEANSDTATMLTGEDTMPTIALDNSDYSHPVTYSSSNTGVATIVESGVGAGTITLVAAGQTTISAIFEGDEDYKPLTVSYTLTVYDNRTKVATPTFSPAAGEVAENSTVTISCATDGATIHYTVNGSTPTAESAVYSSAITIDAAKTIKAIAVKDDYQDSAVAEAAYTIPGASGGNVTDVLNRALTGISGTTYSNWSNKTSNSDAVYAGNSAGGNDAIQLRSTNNSGIVTTTSGGSVARVSVSWNSNTTDGRTLNVYGHTVAYYAASDLYDGGDPGTLLGTIVKGTSTQLIVSGSYSYIGLRSASGAMYLDEIDIEWGELGPTISMNTNSITGVAAAGTTITASAAYNLLNDAVNGDVTITCDGTVVTSASKNATAGNIDYTVAPNTGAARNGWIKVKYGTEDAHQIDVSQLAATYILTLSATNGTVAASVGGTPKSNGDPIDCGATVTITATPTSGYAFSAWDVYQTGSEPKVVVSTAAATSPTTFTMPAYNVTASASFVESGGGGGVSQHVATINFGSASGSTNINSDSITGNDSEGNTWTITTVGTTSFTPNASYAQIGSSSKPATSITFTTTLASSATNISLRAQFGGFSNTAGTVTLKVGDSSIGSGSLNATNDVLVTSSSTGSGTVLTVTVTSIAKGVKCYWIEATYTN